MMPEETLHFLLMRCFYNSNRRMAQQTAALGLLPGQPKMLECLLARDGETPRALGRRCSLDKSTVTALLHKMERQGLVERSAHSGDRRSVRIFLTPAGRSQAEAVNRIGRAVDEEALAALAAEERKALLGLLGRVLDQFEEGASE